MPDWVSNRLDLTLCATDFFSQRRSPLEQP
jgi:hypothetical protein